MASSNLPLHVPPSQRSKLMTLPTLSSLKQTFISKADRFVYHYLDNPGPGTYQSPMREKHSGDFHVEKEERSTIPKQHQWIISKGRKPFQVKTPCETSTYKEEEAQDKKNHSDWGKDRRFNYQKLERKTNVGPGKYNPQSISPKQRCQTLPINSRASPSTYLRSIMQQTRKNNNQCSQLEQQLLQMKIDSIQMARNTPKVAKHSPTSAFKSKSKRLYSQRRMNCMIGPGSYDLQTIPIRQKKAVVVVRKNRLRTHQKSKSSSLLEDQETMKKGKISPGPGSYELTKLQLDAHHKKAVLGLMLKEPRFVNKQKSGPGPGEYMRKRFIHLNINQFQNSNNNPFAKPIQSHPTFGTTKRFQFPSRLLQAVPFGQYDLGYHDISQKLIRQREHLSKLRQQKGHSPSSLSPNH